MRKNILLTGVLGLLALSTLQAQDFRLSPLPQVYETQEDSIDIPTHYSLLTSLEANSSTLTLLRQLLPDETQGAKFQMPSSRFASASGETRASRSLTATFPSKPKATT